MSRKSSITPEDAVLFRDAVAKAAPLGRRDRVEHPQKPLSPRPQFSEADERDVMDRLLDHPVDEAELAAGDALEFRQEGVQLAVMRKLRRGQYARQAELDLHGMTAAEAKAQVVAFMHECQARGYRCVRIVHGKGLRSPRGAPVLKLKLAGWLRQRDEVLAYCSARANEGGTGAIYVLLRR